MSYCWAVGLLAWTASGASQTEAAALASLHNQLRHAPDDATRLALHDSLCTQWANVLEAGLGFSDDLLAIRGIGMVETGKGRERLRVIGWNVELEDRTQRYGCFVIFASETSPSGYTWETRSVGKRPAMWDANSMHRDMDWPGALYYAAVLKHDRRQPVYLLLGWDGADGTLNRKVAETWEPDRNGMRFGTARLMIHGMKSRRLVLEYREDVSAMLRWESVSDRVVMDHLSTPPGTTSPLLAGPDMTYDALIWNKGRWLLQEDIEAVDPDLNGPWNNPKSRGPRRN